MLPKAVGRCTVAVVLAMLASCACAACGKAVVDRDMPGVYKAAYEFGTEDLTLRGDGTYEQAFSERGASSVQINRGRWTMKEGDLVLEAPVPVADGFGKRSDMKRQDGPWTMPVRRSWTGRVRVVINEDLGIFYEKL